MKFERTDQFSSDFKALPAAHREAFRSLIPAFHVAAESYVADPGAFRWPAALSVKPLVSAKGTWEMTWSFSGTPAGVGDIPQMCHLHEPGRVNDTPASRLAEEALANPV